MPESIEQLRAEAESLGISVDGRWKAGRIKKAIDEAKASQNPAGPQEEERPAGDGASDSPDGDQGAAEPTESSERNKDGLIPGQPVDFQTMQRVKRERDKAKRNGRSTAK